MFTCVILAIFLLGPFKKGLFWTNLNDIKHKGRSRFFKLLKNGKVFIRTNNENTEYNNNGNTSIHENTLMKFITSRMERLNIQAENLINENALLN